MRLKNNNKVSLYLIIGIIVILFVGLLILCGLYLDLIVNGNTSYLPGIPESDKWILTESNNDSHRTQNLLVSPSFIGFNTQDTGKIAAIYDEDARKNLSKIAEKYITSAFGGECEKVKFKDSYSKDMYIERLIDSQNYMLIVFYNDIPSNAILTGMFGNTADRIVTEDFYVKYIFILPDEQGDACVLCIDGDKNIFALKGKDALKYDQSEFLAYNGVSGFASFEYLSKFSTEPVFSQSFEVDSVILAPSFSFYRFDVNENKTNQLLKTLGFNTSLLKTYISADNNTISFIDEGKELYISLPDNTITYNGNDDGIHMSNFLKLPHKNGYTFSDIVLCVKNLMSSFDYVLVGGEAIPTVVDIYNDSGEIVFNLKYFYNGIMLTEENADISVRIRGEYINKISINAMFCDSGRFKNPVIPQKLSVSIFEDKEKIQGTGAIFKYNEQTDEVELAWVTRKDGE